jgi:short subunit dehydrogenase-like uncharacterized protein
MPLPARSARRLDILLWGATGFTGQLVAEYLLAHYGVGEKVRWAIGGRSKSKLERVRAALTRMDGRASSLEIVVGDSGDRAALAAAVRDAKVVATTVGPYAIHGRELVAACVDAATDYCDLCGEPTFIRDMIDAHHERARASGARIVPSCGYDSIPSDLGVLLLQERMREAHGGRCSAIKYFAGETKGGFSGGTVASMMNLFEEATKDSRVRRLLADPYALDPDRPEPGPDGGDQRGVRFDADLGRWTGPFVMAAINTRVVRRSNRLLGYAYGRDFRYSEAMSFAAGPKGLLAASAVAAASVGLVAVAVVPPLRSLVARTLLPAPGEGPSKETRERGHFTSRLVGHGEAKDGTPVRLFGTVKGTSDPGYGETAKMLTESAVCLAMDSDGIAQEGGILTPASAMGMRLVERLRKAGMTFAVEDAPASGTLR